MAAAAVDQLVARNVSNLAKAAEAAGRASKAASNASMQAREACAALNVHEYGRLLNRRFLVNFKCYGSFEVTCVAADDVWLEARAHPVDRLTSKVQVKEAEQVWSYEAGNPYYEETLQALRRAADFEDAEDEREAKAPAIGSRFIFHDVKKDVFEVMVAKVGSRRGCRNLVRCGDEKQTTGVSFPSAGAVGFGMCLKNRTTSIVVNLRGKTTMHDLLEIYGLLRLDTPVATKGSKRDCPFFDLVWNCAGSKGFVRPLARSLKKRGITNFTFVTIDNNEDIDSLSFQEDIKHVHFNGDIINTKPVPNDCAIVAVRGMSPPCKPWSPLRDVNLAMGYGCTNSTRGRDWEEVKPFMREQFAVEAKAVRMMDRCRREYEEASKAGAAVVYENPKDNSLHENKEFKGTMDDETKSKRVDTSVCMCGGTDSDGRHRQRWQHRPTLHDFLHEEFGVGASPSLLSR